MYEPSVLWRWKLHWAVLVVYGLSQRRSVRRGHWLGTFRSSLLLRSTTRLHQDVLSVTAISSTPINPTIPGDGALLLLVLLGRGLDGVP